MCQLNKQTLAREHNAIFQIHVYPYLFNVPNGMLVYLLDHIAGGL